MYLRVSPQNELDAIRVVCRRICRGLPPLPLVPARTYSPPLAPTATGAATATATATRDGWCANRCFPLQTYSVNKERQLFKTNLLCKPSIFALIRYALVATFGESIVDISLPINFFYHLLLPLLKFFQVRINLFNQCI